MGLEIFLLEVLEDLLEGVGALLLLQGLLRHVVGGLVALLVHLLAQGLVVHLVVVLALHVLAQFLREFGLQFAHRLDGVHGGLQGSQQVLLADLLHLTFHHHDVLGRGTDHDVHVGLLHLLEGGINHILAVDTGHAHLADGALEGNVRASQGGRGGKACQSVGLVNTVCREQHHIHKHLSVVV